MYPDIDALKLRPDARDYRFDRSVRGYDPQQVDAKLAELHAQIDDLTAEKQRLGGTLSEFEGKIRALSESAEKLQKERIGENLRLAGLMTDAGRIADETKAKARFEAEQLIASAKAEIERLVAPLRANAQLAHNARFADAGMAAVPVKLAEIEQNLREVREYIERGFAPPQSHEAPPLLPPEPIPPTADQAFQPLEDSANYDDYQAFLSKMGLSSGEPQWPAGGSDGNCIGRFGS